jgi:hypothetical protein
MAIEPQRTSLLIGLLMASVAETLMKKLLTLFIFSLLLASCERGPTQEYPGALYFGQGGYLMRFSLSDRSLSIVGHLGDTTIRQVTALGNEYLLIAESAAVNRNRVSRISWINPRTGETADLYAGVRAVHLADPGFVVYDDGSELYAVPQQSDSDNVVIFSHPQKPLTRLLEASPGVLLIETGDSAEVTVHAWDAWTGSLRESAGLAASCRLVGAVWIASLERLACKQRSGPVADSEYLLVDLEGKVDGRLELPAGKDFFALAYVEKLNALVLQESWRGWLGARDKHAVWMLELETGASHLVANNVNLGGSVVYAEY